MRRPTHSGDPLRRGVGLSTVGSINFPCIVVSYLLETLDPLDEEFLIMDVGPWAELACWYKFSCQGTIDQGSGQALD